MVQTAIFYTVSRMYYPLMNTIAMKIVEEILPEQRDKVRTLEATIDQHKRALERIDLLELVSADRSRWQTLDGVVAIPWKRFESS